MISLRISLSNTVSWHHLSFVLTSFSNKLFPYDGRSLANHEKRKLLPIVPQYLGIDSYWIHVISVPEPIAVAMVMKYADWPGPSHMPISGTEGSGFNSPVPLWQREGNGGSQGKIRRKRNGSWTCKNFRCPPPLHDYYSIGGIFFEANPDQKIKGYQIST